MEGLPEDLKEVTEAIRDTAFNFFKYQDLTRTIIEPYNNFLNGPLQEIVMTPMLYGGDKKLGLVEFHNVVLVPPLKGELIAPTVEKQREDLEERKAAELRRLVSAVEVTKEGGPTLSVSGVRSARDAALQSLQAQKEAAEVAELKAETKDKVKDAAASEPDPVAVQRAEKYERQRINIERHYLALEAEILKHAYMNYPKASWTLPRDCREKNETYYLDVYADITITEYSKRIPLQDPKKAQGDPEADGHEELRSEANVNAASRQLYIRKFGQLTGAAENTRTYSMQKLFSIPLMVGSSWCWLTLANPKPEELSEFGECDIAPKGYFIVAGTARVFVTQIKLTVNEPRCEIEKGTDKANDKVVIKLKCETRNRNANYLSLIFGEPSDKNLKDLVKILYMTLPFMKAEFGGQGRRKVRGTKNITFNVLWVFRFYVIWYANQHGLKLNKGESVKYALSEFNLHLRDVCFQHGVEKGSETLYYRVVKELTDTIIHFTNSEESPADDYDFLVKLKDEYKLDIAQNLTKEQQEALGPDNADLIIQRFKSRMDAQFFPQIQCHEFVLTGQNDVWKPFIKFVALSQMMFKYVKCYVGAKGIDDRDSFATIQLATAGIEMGILLRKAFSGNGGIRWFLADGLKEGEPGVIFPPDGGIPGAVRNFQSRAAADVTDVLKTCFSTGQWGLPRRGGGEKRPGVVQLFETKSLALQYNLLRKSAIPMKANSSIEVPRRVHKSTYGVIDPTNTPDSDQVGLIRSLAISVMISSENNTAHDLIMNEIEKRSLNSDHVFLSYEYEVGETRYPLYVNDIIAGYCDHVFYTEMREKKLGGLLGYHTEVYLKRELDKWQTVQEVHIKTGPGRAMRPLIVVKDQQLPILDRIMGPKAHLYRSDFAKLLAEQCVEYVSVSEFMFAEVAATVDIFFRDRHRRRFDYVELDPTMSMSVEIATQPFSAHNPNPRALYYGGMVRQAMSVPMATFAQQQETEAKILTYPHAPLITTDMAKIMRAEEQPHGQMVYVAIKSEPGTDEDPTRWREGFIRNGGLNGMIYHTYEAKAMVDVPDEDRDDPIAYTGGLVNVEYKGEPEIDEDEDEEMKTLRKYSGNRVIVKPGDLLIRFKTKQDDSTEVQTQKLTGNRAGFISHINVFNAKTGGRTVKITVATPHIPREGDKAAEEHSQKGVMGEVIKDEDMPTNLETGLKPDVIFSPTSLPSRMTIGLPLVMLAGSAFASMDKTRVVKNLLKWPREQARPEVTDVNDFWIILEEGYVNSGHSTKFIIKSELVEETKQILEKELIARETNNTKFEYPAGVHNESDYLISRTNVKIWELTTKFGYSQRFGFLLNTSVAERIFITPDEEFISTLRTDEKVILFSQLPTELQRRWYDQNESMLIPNYMLFVPRTPNDESITDATPFRRPDPDYLMSILEAKGYNKNGESEFVDKNGLVTKMKIFSGPLFYMQLAHLTDLKYQVRDQGSMSVTTKGTTQGKSKGGAVRLGELSQYAMYAHGVGSYMAERFMKVADKYTVLVCRKPGCGSQCYIQAVTNRTRCETCGSTEDPHEIMVPYSGLRLLNMIGAAGASASIVTQNDANVEVFDTEL